MASQILQPAYTTFNNLIRYTPKSSNGGLYSVYPQVLYNNVVYQYIAQGTPVNPATNPITYKTPNIDASAVALYTLGGGGSVNVLGTALTGLASASGVASATSTILQGFNFLTYRSYGMVKLNTTAVSITANGNVPLTGATIVASSDVTLAAPVINIPQAKTFRIHMTFLVTTAASSGCTFAIGGTNATFTSNSMAIAASATGSMVTLSALVQPTAASPTIAIVASGFSGTVSYTGGFIQVEQV